jgi:AcrR family transcriptional regulator
MPSNRPEVPIRTVTRRARDRDEILDAAARVFRRRGYGAATVEDIANELGILKGSLYHYIKSKQELLYAVVIDPLRAANDAFDEVLSEGGSVETRIRKAVEAHMEVIQDQFPRLSIALIERLELPEAQLTELRALMRRYREGWTALLTEGIETGVVRADLDPPLATLAFLGMLNWASQWYRQDGSATPAEIAATFVEIGLRGILKQ